MKIIKLILIASFISFLSGCHKSILDNDTRCPFVERGGCQNMEMVNRMAEERRFTQDGMFVQEACVDCAVTVFTEQTVIYK